MPGQEFYEFKHRAIQWMVDPVEDGGLGLDPATAAEMVGHDDSGYLGLRQVVADVLANALRIRLDSHRRAPAGRQPQKMPVGSRSTSSNSTSTWGHRLQQVVALPALVAITPVERPQPRTRYTGQH
jgi:hypothetical protein